MKQLVLAMLVLNCFMAMAQRLQVREVKAFRMTPGGNQPQLQLHEKYDKNGNLLYSYQPDINCTREYTYDQQNRLVRAYQMCGESFWNGTLSYRYPASNIVITQSEALIGGRYFRVDTLDNQKKILASWSYWVQEGDFIDSTITYVQYQYSDKGLLVGKHTQITSYDKRYGLAPDGRSDEYEQYQYDDRDSLIAKYAYSDSATSKRMIYQARFDSLTGKLIESFEQPYENEGIMRKEYVYDEQGRLSHFKNWYLASEEGAWELTREVIYRYPSPEERIEIWRSYYQNAFDTEEVMTFYRHLLMRITVLDARGQGQEVVIYQYTYYDE